LCAAEVKRGKGRLQAQGKDPKRHKKRLKAIQLAGEKVWGEVAGRREGTLREKEQKGGKKPAKTGEIDWSQVPGRGESRGYGGVHL